MMKKIKYLILTLGVIIGVGAFVPSFVGATSVVGDICNTDPNGALCASSKGANLDYYVKNIINTALYVLGALAVIMIIYGGITYVISAGDAKKVEQAKNIIIYSVIGLVIALAAGAIVNFVLNALK